MKMTNSFSVFFYIMLPASIVFFLSCAGMGNSFIKSPEISVSRVEIKDLRLDQQDIVVKLNVFNPNPVPIPIRGLTYKFDINEVEFANGFNETRIDVPASGDGDIDLVISGDIISFLLENRMINKDRVDYSLSGDIAVLSSSIRFPYSKTGVINVPDYVDGFLGR